MVKCVQAHGPYKSPSVIFLSFCHYASSYCFLDQFSLFSLFLLLPIFQHAYPLKSVQEFTKLLKKNFQSIGTQEFGNCAKHF